MNNHSWQPTTSLEVLRLRAVTLKQIRSFFEQRGVLEVETPLLSHAIGSDPNLDPIEAHCQQHGSKEKLFLQTSPEFSMKRLLASGSGPIFQICKAFRSGEAGPKHNPEFTMLEWYRPGFEHDQLMDEVEELMAEILEITNIPRISYRDVFRQHLGIDPHTASASEIKSLAQQKIDIALDSKDKDIWLELLYSHLIEPELKDAVFIHDYPKTQAALARIEKDQQGVEVARRFELVVSGLELANGYFELSDPGELLRRFNSDQLIRKQRAQPQNPLDHNLLAAHQHGLPSCAGVALGIDRLIMLAAGVDSIEEVISFPEDRA